MSEEDIKILIATVSRLSACLEFLQGGVDEMRSDLKSICRQCGLKDEINELKGYKAQLKIIWALLSAIFLKLVVNWLNLH